MQCDSSQRSSSLLLRALIGFVAAFSLIAPGVAQTLPYRLDTISAWGGAVNAFQKVKNIGYCGSGQRFVVLNMSNEANIQEIGSINLHTTVEDIVVRGSYAYTLCLDNPYHFSVIDISTPSLPRLAWTETRAYPNTMLAPNSRGATRIQLYGNFAYLLRPNSATVWVYDITNPLAPVALVTGPPIFPGQPPRFDVHWGSGPSLTLPIDLKIKGSYAYIIGENILAGGFYVSIFDLAPDPLHPATLVGNVQIPGASGGTYHIAVADGRAVVQIRSLTEELVVRIVDVSDPAHPALRGSYDDVFNADGVAIQGNYAFVADWLWGYGVYGPSHPILNKLKGLAILDISNPDNPLLVGTYTTDHSSIHDVRVNGNRAYLSCAGQGLVVLDITNPAQPTRIGGYYSPSAFRIMTKVGNRLYVVDEFNGFTILDVSNPSATPVVLGVYRARVDYKHLGFWNVQVRENLAYLAAGDAGIHVVDVANPASPTLVHQFVQPGADEFDVHAVELDGNILHATYKAILPAPPPMYSPFKYANFDISAPPALTPIGTPMNTRGANVPYHRLATKQGISFCGGPFHFVDRVDTRDALNPTYLTGTWESFGGTDFEIVGNTFYGVNMGDGRFDIVDVTNSASSTLTLLGTMPGTGSNSIGMTGLRAHLSSYNVAGLAAMDCSVPAALVMKARSPTSYITDIVAEGDLVFVSLTDDSFGQEYEFRGGLVVLRYTCYANCDSSLASPVLTANDFQCFLNKFAAADSYANCDGSTVAPVLTANDFQCFLDMFATGCS